MKKNVILNVVLAVLSVILLVLMLRLFNDFAVDKYEEYKNPGSTEENGKIPEEEKLYVSENSEEFEEAYELIGTSNELIDLNEAIVFDSLKEDVWVIDIDDVTYSLSFTDDGVFSVSGDDTTTYGKYSCVYRSDAPQYMYLTLESTYVNVEGFVGYEDDYIYLYSNVEDEDQTPPLHEYYLLRRLNNG